VRDWVFNGEVRATVHILELVNDFSTKDDVYLLFGTETTVAVNYALRL
jgi:hypothetical protein